MELTLMNKDIEVLHFDYDEETHTIKKITMLINLAYAPLGIVEYNSGISRKLFNNWWRDRAIPASRSKFKEVLVDLSIETSVELLEKCYGLSLSDQYWVREKGSFTQWDKVNFFNNAFSEDMGKLLMGQIEYSDALDIFSPDNSSDGNLRKKWKIINGKRCLVKSGNSLNNQEPFNEIIATRLYERILQEDDFVPYFLIEEDGVFYSACETMVSTDEELASAFYIDRVKKLRGNESLYEHYIATCESLGVVDARLKVNKMLVCDYLMANYDRHYRNFGVIRNVNNLKWTTIAPLYDTGSSLWATTPTRLIGAPYKGKPFKSDVQEQLHLVNDLSWLNIDDLIGFEKDVAKILKENPLLEEERITSIVEQVKSRIDHLMQWKSKLDN